jgi:Exportin-T
MINYSQKVNFYESLGVLIGSNPDMGMQQKHTEALMQPMLVQLEEIIAKELYKNDITSGKPFYTTILGQVILVITTFSKGFVAAPKEGSRSPSPSRSPNGKSQHGDAAPSSSAPVASTPPHSTPTPVPLAPSRLGFVKALDLVLRIPVVLPTHEDLRDKIFTFLHRMVEVLGPTIFPVLSSALALLLTHSYRIKDIQEFITLTNQVRCVLFFVYLFLFCFVLFLFCFVLFCLFCLLPSLLFVFISTFVSFTV